MSAKRVKYLSQNWVHQPGLALIHPHDEVLRKFYPDQTMSMGPYIPISYPYPSALAKMKLWIKHHKSGYYVHCQIAELDKIAKEKYHHKKVSQAVCRASWQRCYVTNFDKNNFVHIKKLPTRGQSKAAHGGDSNNNPDAGEKCSNIRIANTQSTNDTDQRYPTLGAP